MASVTYRQVDKVYPDGTRALSGFDLHVADGQLMVLVGPSGCGKSTALRLLAGLDTVSTGELLIDGEPVNDRPPRQRDIAMVFQNYALYPHMTVRDNLAFPLRMMKLGRAAMDRRVRDTARLLDLEPLLRRRPRELSGGQRQRVAMGRALVRQPRVFLMDEPLSNLDARLRTQIRAEIAALQQRLGITTLYVTHDQVEAMTLGQRIAVLNAGRLQQVGEPQALYERPANAFVAGFLGNPGMNTFPAVLDRAAGRLRLDGGDWPVAMDRLLADRPVLAAWLDRPVLAGLRPEAFRVTPPTVFEAVVQAVESLGHERLVYFRTGGDEESATGQVMVARLPGPQAEAAGQRVGLGFDAGQLHFFAADGAAIA